MNVFFIKQETAIDLQTKWYFIYFLKKLWYAASTQKFKLAVKRNLNHYHVFMVYAFGSFFVTRPSSFQQLNPAINKGVNQ